MGYEVNDHVVVTRPKGPHRFFSLIIAGYCLVLSLLLILAIYDHNQFNRLINGNLPDLETELENKLLNAMENRWKAFQLRFNKFYDDKETELVAKLEFFNHQIYVDQHNLRYAQNEVTYEVEINKFSDMKPEQFADMYNGYGKNVMLRSKSDEDREYFYSKLLDFELPVIVDWREEGAVTNIKDQGQCGSCWAFSATGSLEGQQFIKNKYLTSLSEQNLVDCSRKEGNAGCSGGLMDNAFLYIRQNGGIDTEAEYPYTARAGRCKYHVDNLNITDHGFVDIESGNEDHLKEAVATVGPISIAIDASRRSFMSYKRGVYHDHSCSSTQLDHGVLVVGYGTDPVGGDYWLVKNSWGKTWGEDGYIKIARNQGNMCGIATQASYPKV